MDYDTRQEESFLLPRMHNELVTAVRNGHNLHSIVSLLVSPVRWDNGFYSWHSRPGTKYVLLV